MLEQILDIILNIAECDNDTCPGVAFTAVGAAFATQGYYLQSAIIGLIGKGGYEMWAVWLYMFSFLVFIIMIVLNGLSIPKNVMWFVLGPALFNWMVYTGTDVKGVGWAIGTKYVDDENQKRVWEIAEPGLRNIDPIKSGELDDTQGAQVNVNRTKVESTIRVAWLFVYWDNIVSGAVAHLADWVGASKLRGGLGTSNLGNKDLSDTTAGAGTSSDSSVEMSILGNLKWGKLQTISQAKISTPALKDAFVEFMTGTCGVELKKWLIVKNITSSKKANWAPTTSVFQTSLSVSNGGGEEAKNIKNAFDQKRIPAIRSLISAFRNDTGGETGAKGTELGKFVKDEIQNVYTETIDKGDAGMTCTNAFMLIITALRWEVGQTYHKLLADIDNGEDSKEDDILATLFYGWRIPSGRDDNFLNSTKSDTDVRVSNSNLKYFTRNLILDYIIKNEVEFIPNFMKTQYSDQKQAEQAADTHIKATGSQGKFGEVYTWARMMPYVQGILMFVLAGAYPIACIIFIIPGCHKVIVTWAAFWAWVKFWDVGFAVVMVIERSLWGMVGNSTKMKALNGAIYGNIDMVGISVRCDEGSLGSCAFPTIESTSTSGTGGGFKNFHNTLNIFDQGLALAGSLNYGVNNGYYVYLMAALYMAVPVICGQVILQGKHGVGSLAGMMTGGAEKAAGGAAEASAKSQHAAAITNTLATAERQVKADAATKYAMNAMQAGNKAADAGLLGSKIGAANTGMGLKESMMKNTLAQRKALASGVDNIFTMSAAGHPYIALAMGGSTIVSAVQEISGGAEKVFKGAIIGALSANTTGRAGGVAASGTSGGTGGTGEGVGDFNAFQATSSLGRIYKHAADMEEYNKVNPFSENVLKGRAENNLSSFEAGAKQSMEKAYAERQETMARYEGDMAGYEMKRDMAGSMQHIAGVFGVNLMPQQKPYDIKGMMGAGEVGEYKNKRDGNEKFVFDKEGSRVGSDIFGYFDAGGTFATQISTDMNSLSQFNENGIFVNGFTNPTHNGLSATYGNLTQRSGVGQVDLVSSGLGGVINPGLTSMDATHTVDLGKGESAVVYGTQDNSWGSTGDTVAKSTPDGNGYAVKNQNGQDSYLAGGSGRAQEIEKKKEKEKQ